MIFAVDVGAVGQALRAGRLRCPACDGALRLWSPARTRRVRTPAGDFVELTPDRGLCRACTTSHVIVPAWYVPRKAYTAEVVGAALLGAADRETRRPLAQRLHVPLNTVNDWLRRARHAATALIGHALLIAPDPGRDRPDPRTRNDALAEALVTLGDSAAWFARAGAPAPAQPPGPGQTGIDYLRLIAAQHHRDQCRTLHIADPSQAMASLRPWHVVNLLTARRGLFTLTA